MDPFVIWWMCKYWLKMLGLAFMKAMTSFHLKVLIYLYMSIL